jgi:hypothetical protein
MHARFARYRFSGDAQELAREVEDGLLPIFQAQSGFKGYSVMATGDQILSFSAWASAEDAEEANKSIASWVQENMADEIELEETQFGDVLLSTTLGVSAKAGART